MGDKDLGVRKAARALYGALSAMETDQSTEYIIDVQPMTAGQLKTTGGGITGCTADTPRCSVWAASNGPHTGVLTSLAHEAGAAAVARKGVLHSDMTSGIKWENAARRVFGCMLRIDHDSAPASCR
jgi:hypothetical protein